MIAEKWQLSETVVDSLAHHHHPQESGEGNRPLIYTVALADTFSKLIENESDDTQLTENPMISSLLEATGVDRDMLLDLKETVAEEVDKAKIFLQVTRKG